MNHKNFHFTNISDKTHDVIFLKSPKNMFLGHFYQTVIFSKKIRLCHTIIYGPLTPCYVSGKTNEPIPRKLTDRRKDGRTEGRTNRLYFIGPFRKRPGVQLQQKRQKKKKNDKVNIKLAIQSAYHNVIPSIWRKQDETKFVHDILNKNILKN